MAAQLIQESTSSETNYHLQETLQLLLCCAQLNPSEVARDRIQVLAERPIDWPIFFQTASQHGVLPVVCWNLKQICTDTLATDVLAQIEGFLRRNTYHNLVLTEELCRLVECFEAAGLQTIAFKGPILAINAYHNIALRQISDLDLLLCETDIAIAKEILIAQGYTLKITVPWETHLVKESSIYNIDLHNVVAPRHLSHPLTNRDIWEHTQVASLARHEVTGLSEEMSLLVLCLHGTKECWRHLNRVCDVAALVQNHTFDWTYAISLIQRLGYQRLVGVGLLLAIELLEAKLPLIAMQMIEKDSLIAKIESHTRQRLFQPHDSPVGEVERSLFHMQTRDRWQDKLKTFVGLMQHSGWMTPTKTDRDFLSLPDSLSFLYYLLRPIRIFRKYRGFFRS